MAPRYLVWLKDQSGARVAVFDDFRTLDFTHRVNGVGTCAMTVWGEDDKLVWFEVDGQLEVWRSDLENGIDWYKEWEGFCVSESRITDSRGDSSYTVYAVGYLDLLARRIIAHRAASTAASKDGTAASTEMIAYVYQNAGAGATVAGGRLADGVFPGLAINADPLAGGSWSGERAYDNLLDVCQGIADDTGIDFDITGTGAATFVFTVYDGQRGLDRTTDGLNEATGKNSAGNAPVVFSLEFGNMAVPRYSMARDGSANRVFVLGQGEQTVRSVTVVGNGVAQNESPWAIREVARNATREVNATALVGIGQRVLEELQPRETFSWTLVQVQNALYGAQYTWGDRVTGRYQDIERNKRIVGVRVSVRPSGETISAEMADVP